MAGWQWEIVEPWPADFHTFVSTEIRGWCCDALDLVVPWRQSNAKTISVSTRAWVARLDDLIGLKS